ncbi:MAG: class I SAM-dependent methyltransferase [Candidatus Staskawiczbacteria bacterium]|nr:class I SAM-dependent methyltransferase [Candidatus Staskawiczbacteria bacterium]
MKQWNEIYKENGKVFFEPQEDMPGMVKEFKKHKVKKILDLGCGTGRHSVYLAKKGFEVYGIDIAEEGIRQAKQWLKSEKLKANLKIGSIYERLPYENDFFDAIISTYTIHHQRIEKIRKAIQEIERILKPGGFIFINARKRKFRKFYLAGTIIEKYGHQKTNYKVIAPHTYVPVSGGEKGLIHYLFNKKSIKKEFKNFKPKTWVDKKGRHYCFLGKLKK